MGFLFSSVSATGCAPATQGTEGPPPDLAISDRDMGSACTDVMGNLLTNPGFEALAMNASGNGQATNLDNNVGTIPVWKGCCGATETTQYTVSQTQAHCGLRSVLVSSAGANLNVLDQAIPMGNVGKTFLLSGWVNVTGVSGTGQIALDVFDDGAKTVAATTVALKATTSTWFELRTSGVVPASGNLRVRLNSSGSIQAFVDDLVFRIP